MYGCPGTRKVYRKVEDDPIETAKKHKENRKDKENDDTLARQCKEQRGVAGDGARMCNRTDTISTQRGAGAGEVEIDSFWGFALFSILSGFIIDHRIHEQHFRSKILTKK